MLTTLSTIKSRLSLTDTTYDTLLTNAIKAVSARFDKETNRILARTENATFEFDPADTQLSPPCYPIESIQKFELKSNETDGWLEQSNVQHLIRKGCIISLLTPISYLLTSTSPPLARVTYTGGFVLPGNTPAAGQTPLPDDLEQAAVEQVAYWFQRREKLGLKTYWPSGVAYEQFADFDLLQPVQAVLRFYRRLTI